MRQVARRFAILAGVLLLILGAFMVGGHLGRGEARQPFVTLSPRDATITACVESGRPICDPVAHATQVAEDPLAQPPSAHPTYLSRKKAIAAARLAAGTPQSPGAPVDARIYARFMSRHDLDVLAGRHEPLSNPERKVWVVTVYADHYDARSEILSHQFTMVIDAETGIISDMTSDALLSS